MRSASRRRRSAPPRRCRSHPSRWRGGRSHQQQHGGWKRFQGDRSRRRHRHLGWNSDDYKQFPVSGNAANGGGGQPGLGGGIMNGGVEPLLIANSTLSGNSADNGGGIWNSGTLEIVNTVLNTGTSGSNLFDSGGTVRSHGYNLSSDDGGGVLTGPGDEINVDPLLGPLQDNGGPTLTLELLPGSPAIDAGDAELYPPPFYDQRGLSLSSRIQQWCRCWLL